MVSIKNKKVAVTVAAASIFGLGGVAAGTLAAAAAANPEDERIAPGVHIAGVPVGEMTRAEATEKARAWAREALTTPVTLKAPKSGRTWNLSLADAGGRFDIAGAVDEAYEVGRDGGWWERQIAALRASQDNVEITPEFHFDESKLRKRLAEIGKKIRVPARSARAKRTGDVLVVSAPERKGVKLDIDATQDAVLKSGEEALRDGETAQLVIAEEKPRVTAADLGKVNYMLGSFSTSYGSSSGSRRHNVEKAARNIDGTLLGPGEVFSYNDVVGPRTRRLGWLEAPTYQDGQVVPGTGGGICQVSTTLYNAVVMAGLKIVQRSNHSMPVKYVAAGRDATVSYGSIDLKFQNTTDAPLYVAAQASGGKLTMSVFGQEPEDKKQIRIVTGGRRGRRDGGFVVTTYKEVVHADGTTEREVLSTDSYRPHAPAVASAPRRKRTVTARSTDKPAPSAVKRTAPEKPKPAAPAAPASTGEV